MTDLHKCGCGGNVMWNPVETTKPGKPVTYDLDLGYVGCTNCGVRTEGKQARAVAEAEWNRALDFRPSAIVPMPVAYIVHETTKFGADHWFCDATDYAAKVEAGTAGVRLTPLYTSPQPHTGRAGPPLTIVYTNWRGETAERRIVPMYLWHGATEWHPEPQWLLKATDADKGEERDFAWNGIDFQGDGPANAALTVEPVAGEVK